MQRMVKVTFTDSDDREVVEHYGPFKDNQHFAKWLDLQDDNVTFGNHFQMELILLGDVQVPTPPRRNARKATT